MATPIPAGVTVGAVPSGPPPPQQPPSTLQTPPAAAGGHKSNLLPRPGGPPVPQETPPGVQHKVQQTGGGQAVPQANTIHLASPNTAAVAQPKFPQTVPCFQQCSQGGMQPLGIQNSFLANNPGQQPGSPNPQQQQQYNRGYEPKAGVAPVPMYPCFSSPPPQQQQTDSACLTLGGGVNSSNGGGQKMQIPVKNTGGGCPLHRPHGGGTPHMLYWDMNHPTGATIPLRQPTPPVYFNVPESPASMSGSQSPISEMTITSDLSGGEESADYTAEDKLGQDMANLNLNNNNTVNQNMQPHHHNSNMNHNTKINMNLHNSQLYQNSNNGMFTPQNQNVTAAAPLHHHQINGGKVMANGFYPTEQEEIESNQQQQQQQQQQHQQQQQQQQYVSTESSAAFNAAAGHMQYTQTNQFTPQHQKLMQVPTSPNTVSYPVTAAYPTAPCSPSSYPPTYGYPVNQPAMAPVYSNGVPMTAAAGQPVMYTSGGQQPGQYMVHYGGGSNMNQQHQQPPQHVIYDYNLHTMVH